MIRRATADDLGALVAMARRFYDGSGYGAALEFSESVVVERAQTMIDNPDLGGIFVLGDVTGLIWFEVYDSPVSEDRLASERVLWVEPATRKANPMAGYALVKRYQQEARQMGARFVTLSRSMENRGAAEFYTAMKFSPCDVLYFKAL